MDWKIGDRIVHRFNPELGAGIVEAMEERSVVARFPRTGTVLRLAASSDALAPLVVGPGTRARLDPSGETVVVLALAADDAARLADGRTVDVSSLWPLDVGESPFDRLARGDVDGLELLSLRRDVLELSGLREADGLGSFLGGRIRLFPHQLYVAERAIATDPVRWLLADEVGLGKTVEACLILNHLVRARRTERTLVIAPDTLIVQWLGELWRKYHQTFVLIDDARLADVERDYGPGFNPFLPYRRSVVGLGYLVDHPRLTEQAVEAGIDLVIVDEAHHLKRPAGHPGNAAYRAVRPLADAGRHMLLLTATPLEEDAHGFLRLVQMLRPGELPEDRPLDERLARGEPLPPCTSATRRSDVGGLPPRRPVPIETGTPEDWRALDELEARARALPAQNAVARRDKLDRVRRALASGAASSEARDEALRSAARRAESADPRIDWLAASADRWKAAGDRTLVFVAHRETLEAIRTAMSHKAQLRTGVFHEELSPVQRDIEVAQFRMAGGPSILVSTECGGEGRNFEFCTRLVLFDLPWNPMVVEQRIGRLDRIGRDRPVDIVYFRPPGGLAAAIVELYESLGLFEQPLGGLDRELADVERAIEQHALGDEARPPLAAFRDVVELTHEARGRVRSAAYRELHREPFRPEMGPSILERVPAELEELTREVVLRACEEIGLDVEPHRDGARHSIELGARARVESLPGVPPRSSFLGTFDREEAVADESIDFYASGHPLVEGVLAHLEESDLGRTGILWLTGDEEALGLVAYYRSPDRNVRVVAVDLAGREREDWARLAAARPLRSKRVVGATWFRDPSWPTVVRALAERLRDRGRPEAVAVLWISSRTGSRP
jgi:ATP-dependent helicase HepA